MTTQVDQEFQEIFIERVSKDIYTIIKINKVLLGWKESGSRNLIKVSRSASALATYYCSQFRRQYKTESLPLLLQNFQKNLQGRFRNILKNVNKAILYNLEVFERSSSK